MRSLRPAMLLTLGLCATTACAARAGAPYVDSKIAKERFAEISAADMDLLRSKKILFASRSFGLNLCGGLATLAQKDKRYEFLSSYQRFDVFKAGGDLSVIPADAFAKSNFVHFLATYWPHTQRVEELDKLLRQPPHEFGKQVDAVIIYYHTALPAAFDLYAEKMDKLQADYPNVKFIYVTAGFMAESRAKENEAAHEFSEKVRARYLGKAPLYDLAKLLSDDFRSGHAYCPEYSKDPAGVHPNLEAGQEMMAKGFLLLLRDTFRQAGGPGPSPTARAPGGAAAGGEALNESSIDARAVRAILDANGLKEKTVASVAVAKNGRIVELYLQEGGIAELPDQIGALTALKVLHLYGDRNLPHPLLKKVSPFIARCSELEDLLLNQNDLATLPAEIARLTKLKSLSLADNRLKDLPPAVQAWARRFDPQGLARQKP
ncbi:MAG: leucine-rich repeat domain-containing protein [Planctomycetota bacterium]|nr:leucine-rich repeat domain-containing protein [Planctomycetota bacterium]